MKGDILLANASAAMKLEQPKEQEVPFKHFTHTGHKLYLREERFIEEYLKTCDAGVAYKLAGYRGKSPSKNGGELLRRSYIMEEINYRTQQMAHKGIADATEVMEYYTSVMRGEVADQFGLDAPLAERTSAAREIKKHYDLITKEENKKNAEITVVLDWERPEPVADTPNNSDDEN